MQTIYASAFAARASPGRMDAARSCDSRSIASFAAAYLQRARVRMHRFTQQPGRERGESRRAARRSRGRAQDDGRFAAAARDRSRATRSRSNSTAQRRCDCWERRRAMNPNSSEVCLYLARALYQRRPRRRSARLLSSARRSSIRATRRLPATGRSDLEDGATRGGIVAAVARFRSALSGPDYLRLETVRIHRRSSNAYAREVALARGGGRSGSAAGRAISSCCGIRSDSTSSGRWSSDPVSTTIAAGEFRRVHDPGDRSQAGRGAAWLGEAARERCDGGGARRTDTAGIRERSEPVTKWNAWYLRMLAAEGALFIGDKPKAAHGSARRARDGAGKRASGHPALRTRARGANTGVGRCAAMTPWTCSSSYLPSIR